MSQLTDSPAWKALARHAEQQKSVSLLDLFAKDPLRAERLSCEAAGLYLDYSKQRVSRDTLDLLKRYAEQRGLPRAIERMFGGERINLTENRPALHVALRNISGRAVMSGNRDVMADVNAVLDRMGRFTDEVRDGQWLGAAGQRITDVVNIGIGGSDLGPRFVCDALAPFAGPIRTHFIANVDGGPLSALLKTLKPAQTLFVVTSKTFTTQ